MKKADAETLAAWMRERLIALAENRLYYSSRVRYLNAIAAELSVLDKGRRYCFFALNASVVRQRFLGYRGYDFRPFFSAFRARAAAGDFIFRIFCLSPIEKLDIPEQLQGVLEVIDHNELRDMVNMYKITPECFNCVYIVPLKGAAVVDKYRDRYRSILNGHSSDIHQLMGDLLAIADVEGARFFYEFQDYDAQNTEGCGVKYVPQRLLPDARDMLEQYRHILNQSKYIPNSPLVTSAWSGGYDVGILVALPVEFNAIKMHLDDGTGHIIDRTTGVAFFHGTITTESEYKCNVIVAQLPVTGNTASALATALLLQRYGIRYLFHLGIAGGLRGAVNLGDVVVGRTIICVSHNKVYKHLEAPEVRMSDYRFAELTAVHSDTRYTARIKVGQPKQSDQLSSRAIFDGAILSGESVVADPSVIESVKSRVHRKVVAVENEASGVYFVANAIGPATTRYVTIKGISDYADADKSDDWHEYAAAASAAYAVEVINAVVREV